MIRLMTENTENQKSNDLIKIKHIGSSQNRTRQTYHRVNMICLTKLIIKARDKIKRRAIGKRNGTLSNFCAKLTEKFLTIVYKSKIVKFKLDEDPLQCWIFFLTFIESLEMIFSRYTETFEVLLDYPKIGL